MVRRQPPRRQRRPPDNDRWQPPPEPDPPAPGLTPVGGGFYATPGGAVAPTDCGRWPDSPFCGGNPFTGDFADFGLSKVMDECNIGIQFAPSLGFIKLPIYQFVYRFPGECRLPPPPPPHNPNLDDYEDQTVLESGLYITYKSLQYGYNDGIGRIGTLPNGLLEEAYQVNVTNIKYPIETDIYLDTYVKANACVTFNFEYNFKMNVSYAIGVWNLAIIEEHVNNLNGQLPTDYEDGTAEFTANASGSFQVYYAAGFSLYPRIEIQSSSYYFAEMASTYIRQYARIINAADNLVLESKRNTLRGEFTFFSYDSSLFPIDVPSNFESRQISIDGTGEDFYGISYYGSGYSIEVSEYAFDARELKDYDQPPPPPPKDCECMCRCNNDSNNDQLLRLILKRIGPLPASVPHSLVKKNSGTLQIESLAQYIAYSVKQANAQFGQFPQEIKIKDADLTQEGDQQQTVTIPNLAEAIAEIVGLLLVLRSESAANLVASVNAMIEAGSAKQSAILASDYGAANAEFLGYKGKQIERQIPFTFVPGEAQLDKMLKSGEVKVKGWDNADKNDLNDLIAPILEMAAMYRAANFRNVGTSSPLTKIKEILEGAVKLSDAVDTLAKTPPPPDPDNPNAPPPPPKKSDWDEFVESAESGFISKPGITDNLHPYNRPLQQRPKIREIGTDTSEST